MGYAHYMNNKPAFTDEQWKTFTKDVRELLKNTNIPVVNNFGEAGTKPEFRSDSIGFNGVEDDSHETCFVPKDAVDFQFCKTAHKPYDSLVVEVYKLVRKYLPDTELSSDGGKEVFG